jgi:hypothetical protein
MKILGEGEFGLWDWREWTCSTAKWVSQEERAIGGGWIYIEFSQKYSRWAKIQISDKVWEGARHCPAGTLYQCLRFSQTRPDNVRLGVSVYGWLERDLKSLDLIIFTSSTHPSLYYGIHILKKHKNTLKHHLSSFKDPSIELTWIWGSLFLFFLLVV